MMHNKFFFFLHPWMLVLLNTILTQNIGEWAGYSVLFCFVLFCFLFLLKKDTFKNLITENDKANLSADGQNNTIKEVAGQNRTFKQNYQNPI